MRNMKVPGNVVNGYTYDLDYTQKGQNTVTPSSTTVRTLPPTASEVENSALQSVFLWPPEPAGTTLVPEQNLHLLSRQGFRNVQDLRNLQDFENTEVGSLSSPQQAAQTIEGQAEQAQSTDIGDIEKVFHEQIEECRKLELEHPGSLEAELKEWLDPAGWPKQKQNLATDEYYRGIAARAMALGQIRMEQGSRLSPLDQSPSLRFLRGFNYDLGGEAAELLELAKTSLALALAISKDDSAPVRKRKGDPIYFAVILKLAELIDKQLELIYGGHDVRRIYEEIKNLYRLLPTPMTAVVSRMESKFGSLKEYDLPYTTKLARDIVLSKLALAELSFEDACLDFARLQHEIAARYINMTMNLNQSRPARDEYAVKQIELELRSKLYNEVIA